jgi:hypothetical protein
MKNPIINIRNIGKRYFDYIIFVPQEDGQVETYHGTTCQGRDIEIPINKINTEALDKAIEKATK